MNKQTGYWAYFPWWFNVTIPGRCLQRLLSHLTGLGSPLNNPPLLCFMDLRVWVLRHIIWVPASSDLPRGLWHLKHIAPSAVWGHSINFGNYTGSGSFCLVSGFSLAFTHLKSVLWLVRLSQVLRTFCTVMFFLETTERCLSRAFEVEEYSCAEMPVSRSLAGDKMMN